MARTKLQSFATWFFKDKHGHWVVAQFPNVPLALWAVLLVVNLFLHSQGLGHLQSAVLLVWAYLELTQGDSRFRQLLGAVVATVVALGFLA